MVNRPDTPVEPRFFATPADFRAWLEAHHEAEREVWVGLYKQGSGQAGVTWAEAVGEALCFGWIDGVRKIIDETRYTIRFTPRRPNSVWSATNIALIGELTRLGRMRPAGLRAFERRAEERSSVYSYEQHEIEFEPAEVARLQADKAAWTFFQAQPASYRRAAMWWVISAKRDETRRKRLATLIEDSAQRRTLAHLTRANKRS